MRIVIVGAGLMLLGWVEAAGQTAAQPEFEVASVKPAPPPRPDGFMRMNMRGGPGTPDPGQIIWTDVTLNMLLMNAYEVKPYQIAGPNWLESARYDITAKIPQGATRETFRLMLQKLLADRFHLVLHHESREFSILEMGVMKGGVKMKESAINPVAAPRAPLPDAFPIGKDGFPELPPGSGRMMTMVPRNGHLVLRGREETAADLAAFLGNQVGRPVVDKTGLTAKYDLTLEFSRESLNPSSPAFVGPTAGGVLPDVPEAPTILVAFQDQLGLRLEQKKGPLDVLVVDRVERVPTEN